MPYNYSVPGRLYMLSQPTRRTCWATVGTMMIAWKNHQRISIAGAMGLAGQRWADMFADGRGLAAGDHGAFARACGMRYEQLFCYSMDGWLRMLQRHGPLAVVTANPYHARIIVGMHGTGDPNHTAFTIIDPGGARKYHPNFSTFTRDFEAAAQSPRYQVWHF